MNKKKRKYTRTATWYATHDGSKFKKGDKFKLVTTKGLQEFMVQRLCASSKHHFPIYKVVLASDPHLMTQHTGDWSEGSLIQAIESAKIGQGEVSPKKLAVPRWPVGYCVYHVDNLDGPMYRIMKVAPSSGSFEYSLIVDTPNGFSDGKTRQCMERELVSCRERAQIKRTTVQQAKGALQNRDLQISILKDQLHEEKGRVSAYMGQIDTLRAEAGDNKARLEGMREAFNAWCRAFPNMSPDQAARKMEQLQNDRNGMMGASNSSIGVANDLRVVNAKLLEVIKVLMGRI